MLAGVGGGVAFVDGDVVVVVLTIMGVVVLMAVGVEVVVVVLDVVVGDLCKSCRCSNGVPVCRWQLSAKVRFA